LTSAGLQRSADHVLEASKHARDAIAEITTSAMQRIGEAAARAACPSRLETGFGKGFTAKGDVIVAGVADHASLAVRPVYDALDHKEHSSGQ
jgi:hypothetical protein